MHASFSITRFFETSIRGATMINTLTFFPCYATCHADFCQASLGKLSRRVREQSVIPDSFVFPRSRAHSMLGDCVQNFRAFQLLTRVVHVLVQTDERPPHHRDGRMNSCWKFSSHCTTMSKSPGTVAGALTFLNSQGIIQWVLTYPQVKMP